ncbi:MAG: hypothetical protein CL484_10385 [Acidobacteria bacterium]|nr:hypothetical protein [Acidobacteriota bacterium]
MLLLITDLLILPLRWNSSAAAVVLPANRCLGRDARQLACAKHWFPTLVTKVGTLDNGEQLNLGTRIAERLRIHD